MNLYIIDAIGPFFIDYNKKVINWSKIPFDNLETDGQLEQEKIERMIGKFDAFLSVVTDLGYNAISLDDVAHLVLYHKYSNKVKSKLLAYQSIYTRLFQIAQRHQVKIFVNTDIMFYTPRLFKMIGKNHKTIIDFLLYSFETLFQDHPIDGIIFRIGESDGVDVKGDFLSQLVIKTPGQVNRYIKAFLPLFEKYKKLLIFRTWTCGAYPVGDLMWNPKTFLKAFQDISSKNFIISMKYGPSDFYDRLKLNDLFFKTNHQKIIELQARREREGFGLLPYYIGWQYESYYKQLSKSENLVGISVWCQTGGWSRHRNLTFINNSSVWNELNTHACIKIFKQGLTANEVIVSFFDNDSYIPFLKRAYKLYRRALYVRGYAKKTLFFRRVRIPPLLWLSWDHITVNPLMIAWYQFSGARPKNIKKPKKLVKLGKKAGVQDIDFYYDTLILFIKCQQVLTRVEEPAHLRKFIKWYEKKYPDTFSFTLTGSFPTDKWTMRFFRYVIRDQSEFRLMDKILLNKFFLLFLRLFLYLRRKDLPAFVNKQAMPIEALLK